MSLVWQSVPCITPPVAPFLSAAKEREKRTPPKPMVLESFSRLRCRLYRSLSATRTRRCEIRPCLRILSASNSATRSAPVLAWRDGGNLCVCRAGRCGHRPLRLFIGNRCVGVGLPGDPSRTCAAALAKLSLRASDRRHWCGNPSPCTVPLVPRSDLLPHYLDLKSPMQRQIRLGCGPHQIP